MDNENLKPVKELTPFTKMIMTIGTLPSSFYASMSYYESMVWLYEYLKNDVIPTVNNNGEAVEELQTAFTTLKNYIDNYFENLDVQEEINKKLDEMAEDGTITNLIKGYVDPFIDSQNDNIASFESNVTTTLTNYNNKINSLYNYSPIPVDSTDDMTDESKVYVLTSTGKWYFYDGDSWEIGGTYQSASLDDILDGSSTNGVQNKTLTSAINKVVDITNSTDTEKSIVDAVLEDGYMGTNGSIGGTSTYDHTQKISVQEGDVITCLTHGTPTTPMRFVTAFTDDTAVSDAGSSSAIGTYTVPENINYIVVSCEKIHELTSIIITRSVSNQTYKDNKLDSGNNANEITSVNLSMTSGFMSNTGTVSASNDYEYSQKIPVEYGDTIVSYATVNPNDNNRFRVVTAYRNNTAITGLGETNSTDSYEVPFGINYVVVTMAVVNDNDGCFIVKKNKTKYYKNTNLGKYEYKGDIDSEVKFDYCNILYDFAYNYSGNITTLDKLSFGLTDSSENFNPIIEIDSSKVYYKYGNENRNLEHGLTLSNAISIKIESSTSIPGRLNLSIYSNGELYTNGATVMSMIYPNGKPTLKIGSSVLTNSVFSMAIKNSHKDIWMFGDSWLSYDSARMPYYLIQNGNYKNVFINGYSGEGSTNGLTALTNLLKINQPRYLLWLYGMNDSDTETSANSNWITALRGVIALCQQYNIELILATVPDTDTQIMKHKNEIVRYSGYRYVDQEACLTSSTGVWLTGYQSVDGNHPTELGAKALYYRFISDVPELLDN